MSEILQNYLEDKEKTRILRADGKYVRPYRANGAHANGHYFSAQNYFIDLAEGRPTTLVA